MGRDVLRRVEHLEQDGIVDETTVEVHTYCARRDVHRDDRVAFGRPSYLGECIGCYWLRWLWTLCSGMQSFVLMDRHHHRMMDRSIKPLLRLMMRGKASGEPGDGAWRAHEHRRVWTRFRMASSPFDMCVRRMQMVQHWVKSPDEHRQ